MDDLGVYLWAGNDPELIATTACFEMYGNRIARGDGSDEIIIYNQWTMEEEHVLIISFSV